jgi:hypothetical protein
MVAFAIPKSIENHSEKVLEKFASWGDSDLNQKGAVTTAERET